MQMFLIKGILADKENPAYRTPMVDGKLCEGMPSRPSLSELAGPPGCLYPKVEVAAKDNTKIPVPFELWTEDYTGTAHKLNLLENAKAKQLVDLLPDATEVVTKADGSKEPATPLCYAFPAQGTKITTEKPGEMGYIHWDFEVNFAKVEEYADKNGAYDYLNRQGQFTTAYIVEAGSDVVKDGKPVVDPFFLPGKGAIAVVSLTAQKVKNELAGDTDYHWYYTPTVTSVNDASGHYFEHNGNTYTDRSYLMMSVFKIHSFTVNNIHIRRITFGEVWGAIGGMWGGAVLVMTLLFTQSGYVRKKDQKELMVFRFQSTKAKKEALKKAGGANKDEEEAAKKQALLDRLAELEKKVAALTK